MVDLRATSRAKVVTRGQTEKDQPRHWKSPGSGISGCLRSPVRMNVHVYECAVHMCIYEIMILCTCILAYVYTYGCVHVFVFISMWAYYLFTYVCVVDCGWACPARRGIGQSSEAFSRAQSQEDSNKPSPLRHLSHRCTALSLLSAAGPLHSAEAAAWLRARNVEKSTREVACVSELCW